MVRYPFVIRLSIIAIYVLSLTIVGCALPRSKPTWLSVSGQVLSAEGKPVKNSRIQLVLPGDYGMNPLDKDYVDNSELQGQRADVVTDELGSFSHVFQDLQYATALWILPPLGHFPGSPPEPLLYLYVDSHPKEYLSVMLKEKEVIFSSYPVKKEPLYLEQQSTPVQVKGKLLSDSRNDKEGWLAELTLKFLDEGKPPALP